MSDGHDTHTLEDPSVVTEGGLVCAVCGFPIGDEEAMQPFPPNGDWVHNDGEDGCRGRYWDAPGDGWDSEEYGW